MDGKQIRSLPMFSSQIAFCALVMFVVFDQPAKAQMPPRFVGESVSFPLDAASSLDAAGQQSSRHGTLGAGSAAVTSPSLSRPTVLRPPARVIEAMSTPTMRVSGTAPLNSPDSGSPDLKVPFHSETQTHSGIQRGAQRETQRPVVPTIVTQGEGQKSTGQNASKQKFVSVEEALATKGSVTFRKTPLSEVVFLISDLWQINIVAGENISGEVSGAFHDTPLSEVLSAALTATGYSYRRTGNSLVVLSADEVGSDNPDFTTTTIAIPPSLRGDESTMAAAQLLLGERGQLRLIGEGNVLVVDTPKRIDRVRQLFQDLTPEEPLGEVELPESSSDVEETPVSNQFAPAAVTRSGIAYFTAQFTEAEALATPLREALGGQVVVAVFPEENRILVKGSPEDLRLASEAIQQLDRPRPQVRITAMIYDVSLREVERLGVDWSVRPHSQSLTLADLNDTATQQFRNAVTASTGLVTDPATSGAANLAISSFNSNVDVDTLLQALDASSEAKLLADPSVTVGDRHEASIRIVQKIPILAADPVDNSGVVFSQVQFEEAGIILNVLPRISRDGTIEMKVNPEYSVVADFIENNPVIDSRTAETTVRVGNGEVFALGGLRQKTIVESVRGVPYLKDLKYIGKLFRGHDTEIRESELVVFLKPELVTPYSRGSWREQQAGTVATDYLDRIPYAENVPQSPCCKDPLCPHHFPRPRLNAGGSNDMMEDGLIDSEDYGVHEIPNVGIVSEEVMGHFQQGQNVVEDSMSTGEVLQEINVDTNQQPQLDPQQFSGGNENSGHGFVDVAEPYPTVHVDPRVMSPRVAE